MLRGVRGATTVEVNEQNEIMIKVAELLEDMVTKNDIKTEDIGAVIFSSTPELNVVFPAAGARNLGWDAVPLFGTQEIENPNGVPKCIRVLILWNTEKKQHQIKHVYLHGAVKLRPDIV